LHLEVVEPAVDVYGLVYQFCQVVVGQILGRIEVLQKVFIVVAVELDNQLFEFSPKFRLLQVDVAHAGHQGKQGQQQFDFLLDQEQKGLEVLGLEQVDGVGVLDLSACLMSVCLHEFLQLNLFDDPVYLLVLFEVLHLQIELVCVGLVHFVFLCVGDSRIDVLGQLRGHFGRRLNIYHFSDVVHAVHESVYAKAWTLNQRLQQLNRYDSGLLNVIGHTHQLAKFVESV